jgi:hypothetical protein
VKTMKTLKSFLMLVAALAATTACEKNAVQTIAGPQEGGSNVKFFNFAVGAPQVNFYVNETKVTAVSATGCAVLDDANRQECLSTGREATTGVAYGGAGNGAWYADVAPGQIMLSGRIAATTDKNLPIHTLQTTIAADRFYSYYLSGIYDATTKRADSFVVEDVMPATDFTRAYVRFVNASSTAQPMTLYARDRVTTTESAVGAGVAYKAAGDFVALAPGSYDLNTRTAGSSTNVFSRVAVSFAPGRAYTITARGNIATASTMLLDNTANR